MYLCDFFFLLSQVKGSKGIFNFLGVITGNTLNLSGILKGSKIKYFLLFFKKLRNEK